MANSYISLYVHYVFSAKQRLPLILPEIQSRLWAYIGGIARKNKMKALATISISKAVQLIKGNSSKWIHETFECARKFSWQEGYGAFSVNISIVKETIRYIERQAEHHQHRSFKDEYIEFLKKHGIDYDERYVWD